MKVWVTPSGKQSRSTEVLADSEENLGLVMLEVDDECQLLLQDLLFVPLTLLYLAHAETVTITILNRTKRLDLIES